MELSESKNRSRWMWGLRIVGWVILGIITAAALAFVFGYFVMLLWNWLMPELFGLPVISFWQAFGIILLARLIFGGFKHNGHSGKSHWKDKKFKHWGKKHRIDCCSSKDWKHFDEYWSEEGEKSFKEYLGKKKSD